MKIDDAAWKKKYILPKYRGNKDFILLDGLIDIATDLGYSVTESTVLQLPSESNGNVAAHQIQVTLGDGRTFKATGHANPQNVDGRMHPQMGHLAESRALARALRWATNLGMYSPEEAWEEEKDERGAQSRRDGRNEHGTPSVDEMERAVLPPFTPDPSDPFNGAQASPPSWANESEERSSFPKASPHKIATANQLATIAKLSRLVGKPEEPSAEMNSAEASERIRELSITYNEMKNTAGSRR